MAGCKEVLFSMRKLPKYRLRRLKDEKWPAFRKQIAGRTDVNDCWTWGHQGFHQTHPPNLGFVGSIGDLVWVWKQKTAHQSNVGEA